MTDRKPAPPRKPRRWLRRQKHALDKVARYIKRRYVRRGGK